MGLLHRQYLCLAGHADFLLGAGWLPVHQYLRSLPPGQRNPKGKRLLVLAVVALPPFLLAYSGIASFVNALYFAGTFGGVLMGIIPVLLLNAARRRGDVSSEFVCGWYAHRSVQWLIVATFFLSGVYAVVSLFGVLPESW
jgi:amino acid permease